MPKYEKNFTPQRANTASAALYTHLADGQEHDVETTLKVVTEALAASQPEADSAVAEVTAEQRRKFRSTARNALYVARRSGRVTQAEGRVALNATVAEAWNTYQGGNAESAEAEVMSS